jgi:TolB protein
LYFKTERPVTWTPDGRRVLYWNHIRVGWDVWSITADGKESVNLTQVRNGGCRSPAPSPDGKRIAFVRDNLEGLYLMNADGSGPRRLTDRAFRDQCPSWSPDGNRLAYGVLEGSALFVYRYDLPSGQPVRVARGRSPAWSPDGGRLLFVGKRDEVALFLISPDGKDEARLTTGPGGAWEPAWSPDGTRVAYFTNRGGRAEMRVVTVGPRTDILLASVEGEWSSPPSWAPDGKWLTFAAGPRGKPAVYVVDAVGRQLRTLAAGGACFPVWRPAPKGSGRP